MKCLWNNCVSRNVGERMDVDQEPRHCHAAQFTKPCSRWQRYTVVRPKAFTTASISRTSLDSPRDQPRFDTMRFIKTRTISYAQNAVLERLKNARDAVPPLWGKKKKRFNSISACAFTATTRERKKKRSNNFFPNNNNRM